MKEEVSTKMERVMEAMMHEGVGWLVRERAMERAMEAAAAAAIQEEREKFSRAMMKEGIGWEVMARVRERVSGERRDGDVVRGDPGE